MDYRMRQTNYLSKDLGAVVQPQYTSKTWRVQSWPQQFGRWIWSSVGMASPQLSVNPTTTALTEWYKNGDCWCADSPENATVKLQMGVNMHYKVFPESFIIEHIPAAGTRDIASAPRDFQVWVKMDSEEQANKIKLALQEMDRPMWPGVCGDPPSSTSSRDKPDEWVCILADEYDIHAYNYLQSYVLPSNPWQLGLATQSVVLKVTSNWGADHTCLYQIRMTGDAYEDYLKSLES